MILNPFNLHFLANITLCRSYLSDATRLKERTGAVSMVSLAQVLGFIIGPALQAIVTPLGDKGVTLIPGLITLNMYTAAGWINVFMAIGNFCLFLPVVFKVRTFTDPNTETLLNICIYFFIGNSYCCQGGYDFARKRYRKRDMERHQTRLFVDLVINCGILCTCLQFCLTGNVNRLTATISSTLILMHLHLGLVPL